MMTHSFSPCSHTTSNLDNNKTTWHDQNVSLSIVYSRYSLWKKEGESESMGNSATTFMFCFFLGLPFLMTQFWKQIQQVYRYYAHCPSLFVSFSAFRLFILYFTWKYFTVCMLFISLEMTTPFLYCTEQVFFLRKFLFRSDSEIRSSQVSLSLSLF